MNRFVYSTDYYSTAGLSPLVSLGLSAALELDYDNIVSSTLSSGLGGGGLFPLLIKGLWLTGKNKLA